MTALTGIFSIQLVLSGAGVGFVFGVLTLILIVPVRRLNARYKQLLRDRESNMQTQPGARPPVAD